MTATKALGTVLVWALVFTVLGSLVGGILGTVAPDYYRFAFRHGQSPDFNPLQTGIGLGAMQGFAAGIVISLIVLVILAIRDIRSKKLSTDDDLGKKKRRRWGLLAVWFITTSLTVIFFSFIAFILGGCIGQTQIYESWRNQKLEKVTSILDSEKLPEIRISHLKPVQVRLSGVVPSKEALSALHEKMVLTFGTEEANFMLRGVKVAETPQ